MAPRPPDLLRRSIAEAGWNDVGSVDPQHLAADDEVLRTTTLAALSRAGHLSIPQLVAALADGSARVRSRAMRLVVERWDDELAGRVDLRALLDEPDDTVLEVACHVAGECSGPDPSVVDALAAIAREHHDPLCRESAAAALGAVVGRIDDDDATAAPVVAAALEAVLVACRDRATVRRRAVLALAAFDDPRAAEELRRALTDVDWQVRQAAEDLLDDTPLDDAPGDRQTRASMNITLSDS